MLVLIATCGCSRKDDFACVEQLNSRVAVGASMKDAESAVNRCGVEYYIDPTSNALRGVKRGMTRGLVQESRVVTIKFDHNSRVSSVDITKGFTGP